ncbi:hypothetical protein [Ruminococcus sp.]|uniref:hypothetical protein n=1 Tax=Ruminococcus sp. TaxID=41978 RepID=UPI002E79DA17|nr:hypothetical protein [Ruminococcus sp.]MEE1262729.1 hypothetical protein [Ruminococcus sp.]
MNGKLLLLDIDGTLTEPGYNVPPDSALDAIRKAQKTDTRSTSAPDETRLCSSLCSSTALTDLSPARADMLSAATT